MSSPAIVIVNGPSLRLEDFTTLGPEFAALLDQPDVAEVVCDVSRVTAPEAAAVNALARLQLAAVRDGKRIRLRSPSPQLRCLIWLCGLTEVLLSED